MSERTLTEEQREAVGRRSGELLLSAGAGSGKTAVLAERFVEAVLTDGLPLQAILAITFTERAAWELKERVRRRLAERGGRGLAREAERASIGTFHGFCARILREDPLAAGLAPGFEVLEEGLADRMRHAAFSEALADLLRDGEQAAVDLLAAYGLPRLRTAVLGAYAELRSRGERSPSLAGRHSEQDAAAEHLAATQALASIDALLTRFGIAYQRRKRERGAADFDDLELSALDLLQRDETVRDRWAQQLQMVMVDEFQDTNPRQLALLAALQCESVFTVGDEWQSIYGFRHAEVAIFRRRAKALAGSGASIALTRSFRCVPQVIDAVNRAFSGRFGERYTPLIATRGASEARGPGVEMLLTDRDGWDEHPDLVSAICSGLPDGSRWRQVEARLLARRIADVIGDRTAKVGEIAVLLRSTGDLPLYERALQDLGVPTLCTVGAFWLDLHVGDLIAYMRALANPYDELSLYGALASPLCGLSRDALALLSAAAREQGQAGRLWDTLLHDQAGPRLDPSDALRLEGFLALLQAQRRRAARAGVAELMLEAVQASGYGELLLRLDGGARRLANVRKLIGIASELERSEGRDLRAFLDYVEHLMGSGRAAEPDAPVADDDLEAVSLMTIHAAKGLEFPVVCVADLGRSGNAGAAPDLLHDGERVGLRLAGLDGSSKPALDYESLRCAREAEEAGEEDRIIYVAMTRARDLLILSGAVRLSRWPKVTQGCAPIAWLAPALVEDLPLRLAAGGLALEASGTTSEASGTTVDRASGEHAGDSMQVQVCSPASARACLRLDCGPEKDAACLPADRGIASIPPSPREHEGASGTAPAQGCTRRTPGYAGACQDRRLPGPAEASDRLSYTTLVALSRCGYRYYLESVLGLPEEPLARTPRPAGVLRSQKGLDARTAGEIVHRLLEGHDFAARGAPGADRVIALACALQIDLAPPAASRIARQLASLHQAPLARRIAAARIIGSEHPFAFSIGEREPLIVGAFDLIAVERDGCRLIVDYKSGAVSADADLESIADEQFGVQRLVYALAALLDGAPEVEVVHWFLPRPLEPVAARFGVSARVRLEEELRQLISRCRQRGYAVSQSPSRRLCLTCPGRQGLCSWDEQETMREPVSV